MSAPVVKKGKKRNHGKLKSLFLDHWQFTGYGLAYTVA